MTLLYGLVLAGGQSRRMGRDKALLERDGQSLLATAAGLLDAVCGEVFVSVREATSEGERARWPQIADRYGGLGPADGIVSAMSRFPTRGWLVLACDLPRLSAATLQSLVAQRDTSCDATAFRSLRDDLPEPLCAIYEPSSLTTMQSYLARDVRCPRKMLLNMNTHLLAPAAADALANANTPDDWAELGGRAL
ncbi:MAG: NTP transferase domain-containing protein [Pseudomonadota bacterium]